MVVVCFLCVFIYFVRRNIVILFVKSFVIFILFGVFVPFFNCFLFVPFLPFKIYYYLVCGLSLFWFVYRFFCGCFFFLICLFIWVFVDGCLSSRFGFFSHLVFFHFFVCFFFLRSFASVFLTSFICLVHLAVSFLIQLRESGYPTLFTNYTKSEQVTSLLRKVSSLHACMYRHADRQPDIQQMPQLWLLSDLMSPSCSAVVTDNYCHLKWPLHVLHTIITIIISFIVNPAPPTPTRMTGWCTIINNYVTHEYINDTPTFTHPTHK